MLRVTANTQLMKEIVDLLSVLTEEAKLVWKENGLQINVCLLYTSPSPRDGLLSRMPSSA